MPHSARNLVNEKRKNLTYEKELAHAIRNQLQVMYGHLELDNCEAAKKAFPKLMKLTDNLCKTVEIQYQ